MVHLFHISLEKFKHLEIFQKRYEKDEPLELVFKLLLYNNCTELLTMSHSVLTL